MSLKTLKRASFLWSFYFSPIYPRRWIEATRFWMAVNSVNGISLVGGAKNRVQRPKAKAKSGKMWSPCCKHSSLNETCIYVEFYKTSEHRRHINGGWNYKDGTAIQTYKQIKRYQDQRNKVKGGKLKTLQTAFVGSLILVLHLHEVSQAKS